MDGQELITFPSAELSTVRSAETVFKEAQMVSKPWGRRVEALQLYKKIGPSKHLYIEAWQMLGACYRVTTKVVSTTFVDMGEVRGYEAVAVAYHMPSGAEISRAEAMCLSDEENWGNRPKYEWNEVNGKNVKKQVGFVPTPLQQLRSMAQTRAQSKVLSNLFKWVVRQEGFQGTPAEEMTGDEPSVQHEEKPPVQQPQRTSQGQQGNLISEPQGKRLFAIAKGVGMEPAVLKSFLKEWGFEHSNEVTRDKYEEICGKLEKLKEEMGG